MITSPEYKPVQIFISISSAGDSPQIDEILQFCDFFLVSYLVILYYWGLRQYRNLLGAIAPKTPPKGA